MSDGELVRAVLAAAGLEPGEDEIAELSDAYPALRAAVESLYRVPGMEEERPALSFEPAEPHPRPTPPAPPA